ncbi:hypothetical protein AYJ57_17705 [Salipiger sp. CCB-MM3]|uniref:AraC-like ligand-binding domain-containing protein n=1 Tax=Salipiger sp. CCB-MM3 TaxID=1792508 RepID=UPI00080AB5DE|nr:helix-turn-helix domain-containing protein [Salipiger sp. CCB-MM3]ANT62258.1 hypothetical protein AYJ57_17705 [Salipiger sp. CCB-MM3]
MTLIFQTDDFEGADRLAYWQNMISQHHVSVVSPGGAAQDFSGRMKIDDWGGLQFSDTTFSPISYSHGVEEIRQSERDDFLCVLSLEGGGRFCNNDSSFAFSAGDMVVYDTDQIYAIEFPEKARTISLRIPRPLIISRLSGADRQFALHIDGAQPMAQLAAGLMKNVCALDELPGSQRCRDAEAPILDLLCLAARDLRGEEQRPTPGQHMLLKRIKAELMERLEDSTISVTSIAQENRISPRTLNRLFASEGTTVMRWIWSQRLAASYRAMSEGSVRQVTEAAFRFGFKDSSHFARAFRKEFNIPPSKLIGS